MLHPKVEDFLRDGGIARPEMAFIWLLAVNMQQEYACANCQMYLHLNMAAPVGPKDRLFSVCAVCDSG